MSKKIQDNESIKPLIELSKLIKFGCNSLDKIPLIYKLKPELKKSRDQLMETIEKSRILTLPDQFNTFFAQKGWIYHNSIPQVIVEKSVEFALNNNFEEAYALLINMVDESYINLIVKKCKTREHFKERVSLLKLLKIDYLEQRYHACIPLLLALLDGLANDISKHIGFFTEGLDLELFDSMTAHETGLPFLKTIMNSSRKTTTTEMIQIPYRNGILHGRDLNFNNKEVASKSWWALASLLDWADEKQLNRQRQKPISLQDTFKQYKESQELSQRIEKWQKRPCISKDYWINHNSEISSPEYVVLEFLKAWQSGHWGKITPLLLHNIGKKDGAATKYVVSDYKDIELLDYQIMCSEDKSPAMTNVFTQLKYIKNAAYDTKDIAITMSYNDSRNGDIKLRGEPNGKWYVLQASLTDIIFK